jgi:hypothetical protein
MLTPLIIGKAKEGNVKKNTVYLSPICLYVGILGTVGFLLFLSVMLFFPNGTESIFAYAVFGILAVLGMIIILYSLLWRIEYDDESITYRNCLGKRYDIHYSDIISIRRKRNNVYLFTDKTRINIILGTVGDDMFLDSIAKHALVLQPVVESKNKMKKRNRKLTKS